MSLTYLPILCLHFYYGNFITGFTDLVWQVILYDSFFFPEMILVILLI